jgi:hypothetical protein
MSQSKAIDGYLSLFLSHVTFVIVVYSLLKTIKLYVILSIIKSIDETIIICQSHAEMNET